MRYWLFATAILFGTLLHAEITYNPVSGWKSSDNVLETRLSQGLENPDTLRLMNQAADIYKRGDKEKARTTYREVVHKYPTSLLAPQAHYEIAKIRLEQKQVNKAYESYGYIVSEYPGYSNFDKVLKEMFDLAERLSNEKTASVFGVWSYRDRDAAIEAFEKIVIAAPYSDYAPKALYTIAQLYKEKGEKLSTIDAYERLIGSYPNNPLACESYLALADTYKSMVAGAPYDQGATQQAIRYYEEFTTLYPDDGRVSEAAAKMGQMKETLARGKYDMAMFYYQKRHNSTAAIQLLQEVIQTAPDSDISRQSQKMIETISQKKPVAEGDFSKKLIKTLTFWKK